MAAKPRSPTTAQTVTYAIVPPLSIADSTQKYLESLAWRAVRYTSISIFYLIVYGFAFLCEYLLMRFLWYLLDNDVQNSPLLQLIATNVQIGLAVCTLVGAIVHNIFSIWSQFKMEQEIAKGG